MQDILTYGCVNTVNPAYARVKEREPHTSYTTDLDMCLEVSEVQVHSWHLAASVDMQKAPGSKTGHAILSMTLPFSVLCLKVTSILWMPYTCKTYSKGKPFSPCGNASCDMRVCSLRS